MVAPEVLSAAPRGPIAPVTFWDAESEASGGRDPSERSGGQGHLGCSGERTQLGAPWLEEITSGGRPSTATWPPYGLVTQLLCWTHTTTTTTVGQCP